MNGSRSAAVMCLVLVMIVPGIILLPDDSAETAEYVAPESGQITKPGHGILEVAVQDDPKTLNTLVAQDVWDWTVLSWIIDCPVRFRRGSGEPFPWMAESWEYDPADPLRATMTLKKGIYWTDHDFDTYGEEPYESLTNETHPDDDPPGYREVTAYDVVFSYELMKDPPRYSNDLEPLRIDDGDLSTEDLGVRVVDRYTIEYNLSRPTSDFVGEVLSLPVWPEHIWSSHLDDKLTWQPEMDEVVYCGMFVLEEWVKGSYVTIRTNEHYFNKSAIPNIDGILFRIYTNTDAAILALESGEVDLVGWSILPGYIPQIQEKKGLEVALTEALGFFYVSYNLRNPAFGYDYFNSPDRTDVGKPLRRAIAHCANKEKIVLSILQGAGAPGDSVVSPANARYYNDSVRKYPFDPAKAAAVLDAAGYYKVDGYYVSPDGGPIDGPGGDGVITIIHPPADYDPPRAEAARMLADQMNEVGIPARNVPTDYGILLQKINERNFEMYVLGFTMVDSDAGYLRDFFVTDPLDVPGGFNMPGYRNSSYDAVVERMAAELNVDKRIELAKRAQGIIAEDLVYDVLYYRDTIEAYRTSDFPYGWFEEPGRGVFNWWTVMGLGNFLDIPDLEPTLAGPDKIRGPAEYIFSVSEANVDTLEGFAVRFSATDGVVEPATVDLGASAGGRVSFTYTPSLPTDYPSVATLRAVITDGVFEIGASMLVSLMPPDAYWIRAEAETGIPMPVDFEESRRGIPITVSVMDHRGWPVEGANVTFRVYPQEGVFSASRYSTDSGGLCEVVFTPPADAITAAYDIQVTVISGANESRYEDEEWLTLEITPPLREFDVAVSVSDVLTTGETATIRVTVTENGPSGPIPLSGVQVAFVCDDPSLLSDTMVYTDGEGKAGTDFSAAKEGNITVSIIVSGDGFVTVTHTETISVEPEGETTSPCLIAFAPAVLAPLIILAVSDAKGVRRR